MVNPVQNNYGSINPPAAGNDSTQGFSVGSEWYDQTDGLIWECLSAAPGAAVWKPRTSGVVASLRNANMNSTADQPFTMHIPAGKPFHVTRILATNAAVSMTTAVGGVYTGAVKSGTTIVAGTQVYTALAGATTNVEVLTITAAGSNNVFTTAPILSLGTVQGATAAADFYLVADTLPLD
jgi:hypothetical protein